MVSLGALGLSVHEEPGTGSSDPQNDQATNVKHRGTCGPIVCQLAEAVLGAAAGRTTTEVSRAAFASTAAARSVLAFAILDARLLFAGRAAICTFAAILAALSTGGTR